MKIKDWFCFLNLAPLNIFNHVPQCNRLVFNFESQKNSLLKLQAMAFLLLRRGANNGLHFLTHSYFHSILFWNCSCLSKLICDPNKKYTLNYIDLYENAEVWKLKFSFKKGFQPILDPTVAKPKQGGSRSSISRACNLLPVQINVRRFLDRRTCITES